MDQSLNNHLFLVLQIHPTDLEVVYLQCSFRFSRNAQRDKDRRIDLGVLYRPPSLLYNLNVYKLVIKQLFRHRFYKPMQRL